MIYGIRRFQNPVFFQGDLRTKRYFEGWYFKHVSADRSSVCALIPGISLSPRGSTSFIQFIDGSNGRTRWFPFPLEAFDFSRDRFEVRIGDNRFSLQGIQARLRDEEGEIEAGLTYWGVIPLPFSVLRPGIMGPFTYAPFMECYHGIGSLDHGLYWSMSVDGRRADFTGGRDLDVEVQNRSRRLQLHVERSHEGVLLAPVGWRHGPAHRREHRRAASRAPYRPRRDGAV